MNTSAITCILTPCEDCTRMISGAGRVSDDGKFYHIACAERIERNGNLGLKVFKVDIRFSGRTTIKIVASSEEEAVAIANVREIEHDNLHFDIDGADETDETPSPDDIDSHRRDLKVLEEKAARKAAREAAKLTANSAGRGL